MENAWKDSFVWRIPANDLLYGKDLSSVKRRPVEDLLHGEDLSKVFCMEKTCRSSSMLRRSAKDLEVLRPIYGKDLLEILSGRSRSSMKKRPVRGFLWKGDLLEVFYLKKIYHRSSIHRRPISCLFYERRTVRGFLWRRRPFGGLKWEDRSKVSTSEKTCRRSSTTQKTFRRYSM